MPLVWNLPEWLLPVNHPFSLGQELKQDRLKKIMLQFYPWIWWIRRHAATLWRTKVMNFPFSFIYFSNILKNGTDAFSVMQTNSVVLSRKWMSIPTSCYRTLVGQNHRENIATFKHWSKKKKTETFPFLFFYVTSSVLIVTPDATMSLFRIPGTYFASWLKLSTITARLHIIPALRINLNMTTVQSTQPSFLSWMNNWNEILLMFQYFKSVNCKPTEILADKKNSNNKKKTTKSLGYLAFELNFRMHLKCPQTFTGELQWTFYHLLNSQVQLFRVSVFFSLLCSPTKWVNQCLIHESTCKCSASMTVCFWTLLVIALFTFWLHETKTTSVETFSWW